MKEKAALIIIPASGGARMQEGAVSLMQMPRSIVAVQMVKDAGLPYIVLLTDPTTGGVSASFAMVGDIHIAEPGTMIGFAGKRVIQETIREELPAGFQTAEYLLKHGMIDMVVHRKELRGTLIRILGILLQRKASPSPIPRAMSRAAAVVLPGVCGKKTETRPQGPRPHPRQGGRNPRRTPGRRSRQRQQRGAQEESPAPQISVRRGFPPPPPLAAGQAAVPVYIAQWPGHRPDDQARLLRIAEPAGRSA